MLVVPHSQVSIAQSRTAPLQLYHRITRGYMFALFQSLNREQPLCNPSNDLSERSSSSCFNRSIANSPSATSEKSTVPQATAEFQSLNREQPLCNGKSGGDIRAR